MLLFLFTSLYSKNQTVNRGKFCIARSVTLGEINQYLFIYSFIYLFISYTLIWRTS